MISAIFKEGGRGVIAEKSDIWIKELISRADQACI